jgi:uncharacterized protein (TIGR04222 family)
VNPFDWSGPSFLAFYVALCVAAVLFVYCWWQWIRDEGEPKTLPSDPYLLAYLAGGPREALRAALLRFSLEGALTFEKAKIARASSHPKRPHGPFEAAVWNALGSHPRTFSTLLEGGGDDGFAGPLRDRLESSGLVRPRATVELGRVVVFAVVGLLLAVALVKIGIGVSRGRPVAILGFLAIVTLLIGANVRLSPLSGGGARALDSVRGLLEGARVRASWREKATLQDDELVMVAAVFGLAAVASGDRPLLLALGVTDARGGSSSDSSSSGGSSCGGGCGGGGCGGCGGE